MDKFEMAH